MLVFISTTQLIPLVERVIAETLSVLPEDLRLQDRFLARGQGDWAISADFSVNGERRHVEISLDPDTGEVRRAIET
jgi:hypothetical protein